MSPSAALSFLRTHVSHVYILLPFLCILCVPFLVDHLIRLVSVLLPVFLILSAVHFPDLRASLLQFLSISHTQLASYLSVNRTAKLKVPPDNASLTIPVSVKSYSTAALVDTGSSVTLISKSFWVKVQHSPLTLDPVLKSPIVSVDGSPVTVFGRTTATFVIDGRELCHSVYIADVESDVVLGLDFLRVHRCIVDPANLSVTLPARSDPPVPSDSPCTFSACRVSLSSSVTIEPLSHVVVPGRFGGNSLRDLSKSFPSLLFEPRSTISEMYDLSCSDAVVPVPSSAGTVPCHFFNYSDHPITLQPGLTVGKLTPYSGIDDVEAPSHTVASVSVSSPSDDDSSSLFDLQHLLASDRESVSSILREFSDCVSTGAFDTGHTDVVTHSIDTGQSRPIRLAPRRLPVHQQRDVREHVDELLRRNIIRPSSSPWSAPIVVVKKPDNSIRLCVDYRQLNDVTKKDAFPMPRVDDAIDAMRGARYFSTLDLASGYWQVGLDDDAQLKAAFATPFGFYQWNCMPFGLCNAPATFQRLMSAVLHDLIPTSCLVYLDDIIVFSRTWEEHLSRLRAVFSCLRKAGLKVKPSKCSIVQTSVKYLGHIFSSSGVIPDPAKLSAVSKWPRPSTLTEVRQFLGFVSYYRRFIKDFAKTAAPLYVLTKKHAHFTWPNDAESAFTQLTRCLLSHPVLAYPDPTRSFILDTDASDTAIGAVLSQIDDDGAEHPLAYASKTLSASQQKYTVTKRELLAVLEFCHHFRHYLLGAKFLLRTDHKSLVWLSSFKSPDGIVARWIEQLSAFDYNVQHRPGHQHANADSLSRLGVSPPAGTCSAVSRPGATSQDTSLPTAQPPSQSPDHSDTWMSSETPETLRKAQESDSDIGPAFAWLTTDEKPAAGSPSLDSISQPAYRLWQQFDRLQLHNGVLYRKYFSSNDDDKTPTLQLVVPTALRRQLLTSLHNDIGADHLGITRTTEKARQRFYWPGMAFDIAVWIRACTVCQQRKSPTPHGKAPLQQQLSSFPGQRVALDIMGPLPITERGNRYVP